MKQDKETQNKFWVLIQPGCVEKRLPFQRRRNDQRTTIGNTHGHDYVCCSGALLHDDSLSLAQSAHVCPLHVYFSQQKVLVGNGRLGHLVHTLIWNPMSITSTTFGTLCWNYVTHISASPWKRYLTRKIWDESHLSFLHWTSYATKNEPAYEKKTSTLTSRTSQAGLEMTKRACGDAIRLDNYDSQSSKFAQQKETGPFLLGSIGQYTTGMCVTPLCTTL